MHIDMSCGDSVLLHLRSHKSEDAVHVHRGKLKGNEKRRNGRNLEMGGEQLAFFFFFLRGYNRGGGKVIPRRGVGDGGWQGLASLQGSMHQ